METASLKAQRDAEKNICTYILAVWLLYLVVLAILIMQLLLAVQKLDLPEEWIDITIFETSAFTRRTWDQVWREKTGSSIYMVLQFAFLQLDATNSYTQAL